jgi:hypothetical protein
MLSVPDPFAWFPALARSRAARAWAVLARMTSALLVPTKGLGVSVVRVEIVMDGGIEFGDAW